MSDLDYDVVIVGAGISGLNCAYRLQQRCPLLTYTILENRSSIGGTWDLFKYPGIRSDSDLHTFGFAWRPWNSRNPIAEAPAIKQYLSESIEEFGIDKNIQFQQMVNKADWSSKTSTWTLDVTDNSAEKSAEKKIRTSFIVFATGYYDYKNPLAADIPGLDQFKGQVIHPQFWPEDLELKGKKVVIIGSGATAITLLPNVAKEAAETVMLQRSPSYIFPLPQSDPIADLLKLVLPISWVAQIQRVKFLFAAQIMYTFCRTFPNAAKSFLQGIARKRLPKDMAIDPNFNPRYKPWDQRLCLCPDGDFYRGIRKDGAKVVTGTIDTVTEKSIVLKDTKQTLTPDIIVTATGLRLLIAGGIKIHMDGKLVNTSEKKTWKSTMLQDVPNVAFSLGYVNASWTLGADCAATVITRQLNYMREKKLKSATPTIPAGETVEDAPLLAINSTYVIKALNDVPKAGNKGVWRARQNYITDSIASTYGSITDSITYA